MKIIVTKSVTKKEVVANFIGNILTRVSVDIADKAFLILTNDTLYLEYKGHGAIGYAEETREIDEILLKDLKEFLITNNRDE